MLNYTEAIQQECNVNILQAQTQVIAGTCMIPSLFEMQDFEYASPISWGRRQTRVGCTPRVILLINRTFDEVTTEQSGNRSVWCPTRGVRGPDGKIARHSHPGIAEGHLLALSTTSGW